MVHKAVKKEIKEAIISSLKMVFRDICCKEYIHLARKCMVVLSVSEMNVNLFIADEIQNYSELFKEGTENKSEMDLVIREIIGGDKKLLLMSATPFRYHSKLNALENPEKDANSDDNEDNEDDKVNINSANIDGSNEALYDSQFKQYIKNDTDIYKEFENIVSYLTNKSDKSESNGFDFKRWEKINNEKYKSMREEKHDFYKRKVKEQSEMLRTANISRVERYMAGISNPFDTKNAVLEWDEIAWRELCNVPRTEFFNNSIEEFDYDNDIFKDGDLLIRIIYNASDVWFIYRDDKYTYLDTDLVETELEYYITEEEYKEKGNIWSIKIDNDGYYEINEARDKSKILNELLDKLYKESVRLDYIKSTPALFSFKSDNYKQLNYLKDKTECNILSYDRIINFKPLFATKKDLLEQNEEQCKELIYNARVAKLFEVIFDEEELHKLLFIPPSHKSDEELSGVFKGKKGISKRLFFTDYNMTTKSLSFILSYEANRRVVNDLKSRLEKESISRILYMNQKDVIQKRCMILDIRKICGCKSYIGDDYDDYDYEYMFIHLFEWDKYQYEKALHKGLPYAYAQGSPYAYAKSRKELFKNDEEEIEIFCKAYFKYMSSISSLRVILAYTENWNSIYDAIIDYGKNGCIWDVFDEYADYIVKIKDDGDSFAKAFKRIINIEPRTMIVDTKGSSPKYKYKPNFAIGHYAGDRISNLSSAKTLDNKIQRFNSPFWPFNFISTSIGQEGFDFHVYCRKVVHWSLEYNPVKFEQREGRINRYQSYVNRLNLDLLLKKKGIEFNGWKNAFTTIREQKDAKIQNDKEIQDMIEHGKGLFPDFVVPAINDEKKCYYLERECYFYPNSYESKQLNEVLKAVGYYRALLGQYGYENYEDIFREFIKKCSRKRARRVFY